MPTFENALLRQQQSEILTPKNRVSTEQILAESGSLRTELLHLGAKRVALVYSDTISFVTALVAFDGVCESMYLCSADLVTSIPADLTRWHVDTGIKANKNAEGGDLLATSQPDSQAQPINTKWYLASSGTSGQPKWFSHSFNDLTRHIKVSQTLQSLCWANLYQPYRYAGLQVLLQALLSGAKLVMADQKTVIGDVKFYIQYQVCAISATPSMWRQLLMTNQVHNLSLSHITLGGEIADQGILDSLSKHFPSANIRHIYASTEAGVGFVVADKRVGFPSSWLQQGIKGIALAIDDNQHLLIKPQNQLDKTLLEFVDDKGFFDTQDRVELVQDRVLFIGRASGIINVGGNKVHPEKVEAVLLSVEGVLQAKVYAKANSVLGALVEAEIVENKKLDWNTLVENIRAQCKLQLQRFEIPVKLRPVNSIEVNSSGKLSRSNVNV